MMLIVFVAENNAGVSATDDDEDKTNDVNGGTMTSEYRRQKKVIYEVIV